MAMVVKNNMSAIHTLNTLNKNSSALQKSLGKVSSGMKINTAQDDASGYAISEKMRVQIRSLDQANQNTQNDSAMMKTAEGAVNSTIEILKSLKEKAINAANDSNTDSDRATIQKEMNQFIDQIDDNALTTFNGKYLVDGSKNNAQVATKSAFTNQSLGTDTTADSALTDLTNRSGESLEIVTTDYVTASFVKDGRTYSTTFQIGTSTPQSAFEKTGAAPDENGAVSVDMDTTSNSGDGGMTLDQVLTKLGEEYVRASGGTAVGAKTPFGSPSTSAAASKGTGGAGGAGGAQETGKTTPKGDATKLAEVSTKAEALKTAISSHASYAAFSNDAKQFLSDWVDSAKATDSSTAEATLADYTTWTNSSGKKWSEVANTTDAAVIGGVMSDASITSAKTALESAISDYNNSITNAAAVEGAADTNFASGASGSRWSTSSDIGMNKAGDMVSTPDGTPGLTITSAVSGLEGQIAGITFSITDSQGNVKKAANAALDQFKETIRAENKTPNNSLNFQVGAAANQSIKVSLTDMRSEALGLKGSDNTKLSVATKEYANAAVNVIDNALQKAIDQQTTIGAIESRLDYTSSNLTTSSENVQSAESTIRDADMAKEMTEYTKNNVLLQAAQSMLAQANQNSSAVLSLLQ